MAARKTGARKSSSRKSSSRKSTRKSTRKSSSKRSTAKKSTRKAGAKKSTRKSTAKKSSRKTTGASKEVASAMRRRKKGTLKRGPGGRGGKVTSKKQAIAIGLSEAREKGKKVPARKSSRKRSS